MEQGPKTASITTQFFNNYPSNALQVSMSRSYSSFSELPTTTQHAMLLHCAALRLHPFIQVLPVCPPALLSTSPRLERFSPSPPRHLRPTQTLPSSLSAIRVPSLGISLPHASSAFHGTKKILGASEETIFPPALSPNKQHSLGSPNASSSGSNIS
ncbi:hypothetical protein CCHR01_08097 [Colletotrichum chrysophilum]|uniref:Uncharacterized protein n=1 Tax=Colletotrichum chrysophilum TaxID=1836956 RepID=A0AAD9AM08_9PEZI|nr:hypothetical protein CCHR01_08097 [Colletotrichum chrysophilum]